MKRGRARRTYDRLGGLEIKRKKKIRIYERNNQWSKAGRMKRKKIKNLQEREKKRDREK